jgi:cytochrome c oxidase subunit II
MKQVLIHFCVALFSVSAGLSQPSGSGAPPRIEITAKRFAFEPGVVTLKKDETVLLVLKSVDVRHGLRIRELELDLKASKDKPAEMLFTPHKAGNFLGHCSVFCGAGHGSMKITFHVVE